MYSLLFEIEIHGNGCVLSHIHPQLGKHNFMIFSLTHDNHRQSADVRLAERSAMAGKTHQSTPSSGITATKGMRKMALLRPVAAHDI